jgi:hypothetical protein
VNAGALRQAARRYFYYIPFRAAGQQLYRAAKTAFEHALHSEEEPLEVRVLHLGETVADIGSRLGDRLFVPAHGTAATVPRYALTNDGHERIGGRELGARLAPLLGGRGHPLAHLDIDVFSCWSAQPLFAKSVGNELERRGFSGFSIWGYRGPLRWGGQVLAWDMPLQRRWQRLPPPPRICVFCSPVDERRSQVAPGLLG